MITESIFQGNPPFEKPSIAKGVTNFVLFKFGHLPQKDWQTMYDLAKMFLHCLNHWKLETPTARKQLMSSDDISAYKVSKWLYDTNLQNLLQLYIDCNEVLAPTIKKIIICLGQLHQMALLLSCTSILRLFASLWHHNNFRPYTS